MKLKSFADTALSLKQWHQIEDIFWAANQVIAKAGGTKRWNINGSDDEMVQGLIDLYNEATK